KYLMLDINTLFASNGGMCDNNIRERTLIAVKPDGVQRRLVGQIMQRFEQRGFKLVGLKMLQVSDDLLSQHYCELRTKPFYPRLLHYMTSGPVVAMVWEGHKVVQTSRTMVGHTNPAEAQAGTVRGDFSFHVSRYKMSFDLILCKVSFKFEQQPHDTATFWILHVLFLCWR
uniref:Nucleoside diphosphate kinase B n=1 Tax=Cyclopterus lumpus TaxID=8103 RepID=A0A8C2Z3M8_CYCLU